MEWEPEVVVLGAGYVGLTLGLFLASRRVPVLIVDTDAAKVERLQRGDSTIYEADIRECLTTALESGCLRFSSRPPQGARAWIVAVPYLPSELTPDGPSQYLNCLEPIRGLGSTPPVVMIRSTVPVGFTRSKIIPRLETLLGGRLDRDFFLSVCPERTLTGKAIEELGALPQLIGGSRPSVEKTLPLFERCGVSCVPLEPFEAAELGKAICNLSRLAQFNLANFFGLCCEAFGVNAQELRPALMAQYPRLQFPDPGPGVGGSCLPKDSLVLWDGLLAQALNRDPAGEVWAYPRQQYHLNEQLIARVAQAVVDFVRPHGALPVLACGIAFKGMPRTDDTRNSVGLKIVQQLQRAGVEVRVYDLGVQPAAVRALGLQPAAAPMDPAGYAAILLLNNDPGYLRLLEEGIPPGTEKTVDLYDPWRLLLADNPSVFAKAVPLDRLREQIRSRSSSEGSDTAAIGKDR